MSERRPPTRRRVLGGLAAAATGSLVGCSRFDASSWFMRERYDVDRRFQESIEEIGPPVPPQLDNESRWSALVLSDMHFWEDEFNTSLIEAGDYLARHPVDFVLQLGDVADAGYAGEYATAVAMLAELGVPYYACLGNHDVWHDGWEPYKLYFGASAYRLPVGDVLFLATDLAGATLGGLQRGWFEEELANATAEHIIVMGHYPLWTPTALGFSHLASEQEVYDMLDLMRTYGVDSHLSGHTHRYAYTEVEGTKLITMGSMKEAHADRCGVRIDFADGELSYERIEFPFIDEEEA
jgi:3',5'-cyclic AMP phosphodiesterase CpdA